MLEKNAIHRAAIRKSLSYKSDAENFELGVAWAIEELLKDGTINLPKCTRVEVIDHSSLDPAGRVYVNWKENLKVQISIQDNERTLKIFIQNGE